MDEDTKMNRMKTTKCTGRILNWLVALFGLFAVALIVNLRDKLWTGDVQLGLGFWLLVVVSVLVFLAYSLWISGVYMYWYGKPRRWNRRWWNFSYYVFAALPVILTHMALLQLLVFSKGVYIFSSAYWCRDFPYFGVPLFTYITCVFYIPGVRMSYLLPRYEEAQKQVLLSMWHDEYKPYYLLQYLKLMRIPGPAYLEGCVRILDILVIVYESGSYFFILSDGEKVATRLIASDFEKWALSRWFFKTERNTYVNMLYIDLPKPTDRKLALTKSVRDRLTKKDIYPTINEALDVSRKLQENVALFLQDRHALPEVGWEEMIEL